VKGRDIVCGADTAIDGFDVGAVDTDDVTEDHGRDDIELLDRLRIYESPIGGTGGMSSYCP
jgi:hypothetical protein